MISKQESSSDCLPVSFSVLGLCKKRMFIIYTKGFLLFRRFRWEEFLFIQLYNWNLCIWSFTLIYTLLYGFYRTANVKCMLVCWFVTKQLLYPYKIYKTVNRIAYLLYSSNTLVVSVPLLFFHKSCLVHSIQKCLIIQNISVFTCSNRISVIYSCFCFYIGISLFSKKYFYNLLTNYRDRSLCS